MTFLLAWFNWFSLLLDIRMNSKLDQNNHLKMKWKKTLFDSLETENSYINVKNVSENLN